MFQDQPAYEHFDPGYGPSSKRARAHSGFGTAGGYQSSLTQELIFERDGSWFHLSFSMYNLESGDAVRNQPLELIQR